MGLATTSLRIGLGSLMAAHGLQKLAGKFGGAGLDGAAAGFEAMGFSPGRTYAAAAGATETVGGALLAAGMWTPLGAAMVTGAMTTAITKVHAKNGPWSTKGGYEFNALIIGAAFALTEAGPGFPAVDGLITKRRRGFGWALAELAVGVGASTALTRFAIKDRPSGVAEHPAVDAVRPAGRPDRPDGTGERAGSAPSDDRAGETGRAGGAGETGRAGGAGEASTHQVSS
jgi:putative oxidoreductase